MRTAADWELLARLFGAAGPPFRHRMSLARADAAQFYRATEEAEAIRQDKERVLSFDKHVVETDAGREAYAEFLEFTGLDPATSNRAATLALEPDYILVAPPGWRLAWASVCFPTRWSLEGKAGRPLTEIHSVVPGLNEELGRKIAVFFDRLIAGEGWSRANWGLSGSRERNQHPSLPYAPLRLEAPLETVSVRLESQHFLKLPRTGAIAFGIRILDFPIDDVLRHPTIAAGLIEQLRTMPADVAEYKAIPPEFWRRLAVNAPGVASPSQTDQ